MITDILIEPVGQAFDVVAIEAFLATRPHTARDAKSSSVFMIASDDDELAAARAARQVDPTRFPTSVILIDVGSNRIDISYRSADVEPARRFVSWLRSKHEIRCLDEELNDLTPYCTNDLDYLFGARDDRTDDETNRSV